MAAVAVFGAPLEGPKPHITNTFDVLGLWDRAKTYTLACLEAMPAEHYGFRPAEEMRSFAEQAVHIAQVNCFFLSKITDKTPPIDTLETENLPKEEVIPLLASSFEYVAEVVAGYTEADHNRKVSLFGGQVQANGPKLFYLTRDHLTHHRGQMVVYLRLKGISPPRFVGA